MKGAGKMSSNKFCKWVAMWGNAMSISENRPESYAKNITLRYSIYCPFDGNKIRLTFDNYCGTEAVNISKTVVRIGDTVKEVYFGGGSTAQMKEGQNIVSDELEIDIKRGQELKVSFYLADYTQLRSSVYTHGPHSCGSYSLGDCTEEKEPDINITKKTNICYFLSNVSVYTEECNRALVCYGDSITAQDWPDYLIDALDKAGIKNVSVIRRATSGSRILREYSCITYESYGLKGDRRFDHEVPTDGAAAVIIQQGINDIIHPVGTEVNPFRPMSDLPTGAELIKGLEYYTGRAREYGYRVYLGTLLPIEGWRTYADFREVLKNEYNDYMRNGSEADGLIDFDLAVRDKDNPKAFKSEYDSGDHLHPSAKGYERMAEEALRVICDSL